MYIYIYIYIYIFVSLLLTEDKAGVRTVRENHLGVTVLGLGSRAWVLVFYRLGLGFRVWGLGFGARVK